MYSRYHDRPVHVPENYSGCAFSDRPAKETPPAAPYRLDVGKPTPAPSSDRKDPSVMPPPPRAVIIPKKDDAPPPPPPAEEKERHEPHEEKREHHDAAFLQPFQGLFGNIGHAFPFSHGLGFDELLLLGLIILLSQNEGDSDVVLWLALLLFCG